MDPWPDRIKVRRIKDSPVLALCFLRVSTVCNLGNTFLKNALHLHCLGGSTCFGAKSVGPLNEDFYLNFIQIMYKQPVPCS